MTRTKLFQALSTICKTGSLSALQGKITEPTIILTKTTPVRSMNYLGGWEYWEVLCYTPGKSVVALDQLVDKAKNKLKELGVELTGVETPDYFDSELNAYMISVEFRYVKTL